MSNAQKFQLSEICTDVSYGYTESATDEPVGPKFLRITDIQGGLVNWDNVPYCPIDQEKIERYLLRDGDIVVARTGNSTGENYVFKGREKSVFASYLIRFRIEKSLANPLFVWYQMRTQRWWNFVSGVKGGSAQAGANAKVLGTFEVSLPSLGEQKEIVRHLENLDKKIELNRQINQTLEQIAQAIFKSWFVDFEPVKAKAAVRAAPENQHLNEQALEAAMNRAAMCAISGLTDEQIDELERANATSAASAEAADQRQKDSAQGNKNNTAHTPPATTYQQLAATAALFPSEFEESELGEIPKGWGLTTLAELAEKITDGSHHSPESVEAGLGSPMASSKDLTKNGINFETCRSISNEDFYSLVKNGCAPRVGDVLVAKDGARCAETCCIHNSEIEVVLLSSVAIIRPKSPGLSTFINALLSRFESVSELRENYVSGSAIPRIVLKDFKRFPAILPSKEIINAWHLMAGAIHQKRTSNSNESASLAGVRDAILPKLLSGVISLSLEVDLWDTI